MLSPLVDLEKPSSEQNHHGEVRFCNQPLLPTIFQEESLITFFINSPQNVQSLPLSEQVDHQSYAENQSNAYASLQTVPNTHKRVALATVKCKL